MKNSVKLIILQWGQEKSIVKVMATNKVLLITNDYLMTLDELGLVK